ncbi:MAG: hypothetical protein ABWZ88_08855 [Variovorax sp.]
MKKTKVELAALQRWEALCCSGCQPGAARRLADAALHGLADAVLVAWTAPTMRSAPAIDNESRNAKCFGQTRGPMPAAPSSARA